MKVIKFVSGHRKFNFTVILGYMLVWCILMYMWTNHMVTPQNSNDSLCQSLVCNNNEGRKNDTDTHQRHSETRHQTTSSTKNWIHNQTKDVLSDKDRRHRDMGEISEEKGKSDSPTSEKRSTNGTHREMVKTSHIEKNRISETRLSHVQDRKNQEKKGLRKVSEKTETVLKPKKTAKSNKTVEKAMTDESFMWANHTVTPHNSHDSLCQSLVCNNRDGRKNDTDTHQRHSETKHQTTSSMKIWIHNQTKDVLSDKGRRHRDIGEISEEKGKSDSPSSEKRSTNGTYREMVKTSHIEKNRISETRLSHVQDRKNQETIRKLSKNIETDLKPKNTAKSNKTKTQVNTAKTNKKVNMAIPDESFKYSEIMKYFKLSGQNANSLVNLHRYNFSLLPSACSGRQDVNIIIVVHTALTHVQKRQTLRDSFRENTTQQGFSASIAFLIGQTNNLTLQKMVLQESRIYQDIVQGNFLDTYGNLTYKHIMGYHWIASNCKDVEYVIKIDDDVIINIRNIIKYILEKRVPDGYIACSAYRKSKIKQQGKWSKLQNQYPFIRYPPYCAGYAYLVRRSVVVRLYNASSNVRFFWIDDVYVTGLLTLITGTQLQDFSETEARKHLVKSPIPHEIKQNALFILNHPE